MPAVTALLHKTRWQTANGFRMARHQSAFKWIFILFFALCFEGGLFVLFLESFRFLDAFGGAGMLLIGRLFSLFFLGVGSMLAVSSIVTSYSTLFGSDEIPFLLVRPFTHSQIVITKFIEATGFASWSFFFVVVPFVGAYSWHQQLSPAFALWTLLFSIPFLVICSGIGTLIVMIIVRWLPRGKTTKRIGITLAILLVALGWHATEAALDPLMEMQFNIAQLIPGLRLSSHPLNPCWWLAEGIMSLTRGRWLRGLLFFSTLMSSAGLLIMLIEWLGRRTFYDAWQKTIATGRAKRKPVLLPHIDMLRSILPSDVSAIITKDIRIFFRDPVQWTQALVFFGLLGLYFANLRTFNYDVLSPQWRSAIAFLNVFAVSAVLSSLGSRFIFPQLSLEGHGFWLLGLSPATKRHILAAKFLLALVSQASISIILIWLSGRMLATSASTQIVAVAIITCIALAVCGVSTGLGALFMNLRQRNPAAIVSGFGGTLNLVLCLGFMLLTILPFGILFHLESTDQIPTLLFDRGLAIACAWLMILTALTTIIPLTLGLRALENRDY